MQRYPQPACCICSCTSQLGMSSGSLRMSSSRPSSLKRCSSSAPSNRSSTAAGRYRPCKRYQIWLGSHYGELSQSSSALYSLYLCQASGPTYVERWKATLCPCWPRHSRMVSFAGCYLHSCPWLQSLLEDTLHQGNVREEVRALPLKLLPPDLHDTFRNSPSYLGLYFDTPFHMQREASA